MEMKKEEKKEFIKKKNVLQCSISDRRQVSLFKSTEGVVVPKFILLNLKKVDYDDDDDDDSTIKNTGVFVFYAKNVMCYTKISFPVTKNKTSHLFSL
jgi:hypothetical protein